MAMPVLSTLISVLLVSKLIPVNSQPIHSSLSAAQLLDIAPLSATCESAEFPAECRTATQAAPWISASFASYNITHPAVKAALVSLMVFESGEFRYSMNHWPGVAGQGTRNMQSPEYNMLYARSFPQLADALERVQNNASEVLGLVNTDELGFASAAWFIVRECDYEYREAMWDWQQSSWESYISHCVGANPAESGRAEYWAKAVAVMQG